MEKFLGTKTVWRRLYASPTTLILLFVKLAEGGLGKQQRTERHVVTLWHAVAQSEGWEALME